MLVSCSRDAMSARREHVALEGKSASGGKSGKAGKADPGAAGSVKGDEEMDEEIGEEGAVPPHPGDQGSLRRWEELLRSVDVNGGRWRSDMVGMVGGGFLGGCSGRVFLWGGHGGV